MRACLYLDLPNADNTARTTALLNLRSGAGTSFPVLLVIPSGSTVIITGTIQNGFMPVTYQARRAGRLPAISPVPGAAARPKSISALPPHPHHARRLSGHRSAAQTQLSWLRANGFESITPRTCSTTSTPAPTCQRSQS